MSDTSLRLCGVAAGHLVSGYVKQHLPIMLVNHLSMENDASKALSKGQSRFLLGFTLGLTSVLYFLSQTGVHTKRYGGVNGPDLL